MDGERELMLFTCKSGKPLTDKIAKELSALMPGTRTIGVSRSEVRTFSNGEFKPMIIDSVRGADVYVVQLIDDPGSESSPADNFWELAEMVDAIRRSNGFNGYITVIMPNFFRARQHKRKDREPLSIRLVADVLATAGADLVMALDVHSDATHGCFSGVKFENLYFSRYLIAELKKSFPGIMADHDKLAVASVDLGGLERAKIYARECQSGLIGSEKFKNYNKSNDERIEEMVILGKPEKKNILIVDDMIDTAGTVTVGVEQLKKAGAEDIILVCTHLILSGKGPERLSNMYKNGHIKGVICSDTVSHKKENFDFPLYVVSCAPLFAEAIKRCHYNQSIKSLLE
jgi:ribose-phosphate pyrophosphokinase